MKLRQWLTSLGLLVVLLPLRGLLNWLVRRAEKNGLPGGDG